MDVYRDTGIFCTSRSTWYGGSGDGDTAVIQKMLVSTAAMPSLPWSSAVVCVQGEYVSTLVLTISVC